MVKKMGVFVVRSPGAQNINQGIGRLLAFIIKNLQGKIVIVSASWSKTELKDLLDDHEIDKESYQIIAPSRPILVYCFQKLLRPKTKQKRKIHPAPSRPTSSAKKPFIKLFSSIFSRLLSTSSVITFLFLAPIALAIVLISIPVIFLVALKKVLKIFAAFFIQLRASGKFQKFIKYLKKRESLFISFHPLKVSEIKKSIRESLFIRMLYRQVWANEMKKMARLANKMKNVESWLISGPLHPEISFLKAKKIAMVPDLVFFDFATAYNIPSNHDFMQNTLQAIQAVDHVVCHSNYVKTKHLLERAGVPLAKTTVISHGYTDLRPYLVKNNKSVRVNAIEILNSYQEEHLSDNSYLRNFHLSDLKFIIYSSQVRPNKNFINLLNAYLLVLRKRYKGIKLVLTGSFKSFPEGANFLNQHKLHKDVLFFNNIASETLAALNHLAVCSINPTLFEGGFPFTFCEAYSVETPSLMSRIPVVTETISDESIRKMMLFDPYNVEDMVEKICWGVDNRQELYERQKPLYDALAKKSWKDVASEYFAVSSR